MRFDGWIGGYKVRVLPWVDGKTIYVNVQYFCSGQSMIQPPAFDKSVYVTDNDRGRYMLKNALHSFVEYVAGLKIKGGNRVVITVQ